MSYQTKVYLDNDLCEEIIVASEDYPEAKYDSSTQTCNLEFMISMCVREWLDNNKRVLQKRIAVAEHNVRVAQAELTLLQKKLAGE